VTLVVLLFTPWKKFISTPKKVIVNTPPSRHIDAYDDLFSATPSNQDLITNEFAGTKTTDASYFGAHYGSYPQVVPKIGVVKRNITRTHDYAGGSSKWRARWSKIESSPGVYDWALLDNLVNSEYALGHPILHTLFGTPSFYSARPNEKCSYENGSAVEPLDLTKWDNYCAALATRYAGKITHYEIWNEVNVKGFWTGTKEKLSEMVRRANQTIKAIDPNAKIVAPCVTGLYNANNEAYFLGMMNASDKANGKMKDWIDIVNVHLYPPDLKKFYLIFTQIKNVRAKMVELGINNKPLWNTEYSCLYPIFKDMTPQLRKDVIQALLAIPAAHISGGCDVTIMYGLDSSRIGLVDANDVQTWNNFRDDLLAGNITVINLIKDYGIAAVINGKNYLWHLRR
jgi:hypothetical protein